MCSALFFTPLSEFLLGEKHFLVVTMEDEGGNDPPVQPAATTPTGIVISVESDEENDAPVQPAAGAASASSTSGKKRSAICLKQKLEAIQFAERTSNSAAARKYGVHRKRIQDWRRSKVKIEADCSRGSGGKKGKRLSGGGRSQRYRQVNIRVCEWVLEKQAIARWFPDV